MTKRWQPTKLAQQAAHYRQLGLDDIADRFQEQLRTTGRCKRCGRPLTDPASIERGVGPDCAAR
jgi:hypothetical protein